MKRDKLDEHFIIGKCKWLRRKADLTLKTLSALSSYYGQSTFHRVENGTNKKGLSKEAVGKFLEIFGYSIEDLINLDLRKLTREDLIAKAMAYKNNNIYEEDVNR